MAFYEMLPGAGMPPGLQSGMDSVLNKKFGTSTTYPAEGWPDTVNLMGPLTEKTASGAIVTFADGADAVPLKKCEITLPASLDGYSSVDVVSAGKNLWEFGDKTVDTVAYIMLYFSKPIPAGTYTVSCELVSTTTTCSFRFRKEDGSYLVQTSFTANAGRVSQTLTLPEPAYRVYLYSSTQAGGEVTTWKNVQIEVGSSATDYEPYTAPTTHTASLGRTIYGGTADVVKGQGESLCGKIVFDGSETRWSAYTTGNGYAIPLTGMKRGTWYTSPLALSYPLPKAPNNDNLGVRIGVNNDGIYVVQANTIEGVTDLASFKAWLAENPLTVIYPLDDSESFSVSPIAIDSKAGSNNIWNDAGDTEVTYRSQGTTTPILPTLVTKTITENGTYSAEYDDADGYSEVTVNVESIVKIGINSGKLNIADGTLTSDSAWCYTDPFDCPSGMITMDFGESDSNVGIELVYASDNSHANYWTCGNGLRYREVDISSYYSPTKKARLSFKKQYLSKVLLMDFGNGKIYSSLTVSQFVEET